MNTTICKKENIPLFHLTVLFTLTFFIYKDFGIRMIWGFGFMCLLLFLKWGLSNRISFNNSLFSKAYVFLAIIITMFVVIPYSKRSYDIVAMVISLDISALYVACATPKLTEVKKAMRLIVAVALILSVYVILVAIWPGLYYDYVSKILDAETVRISNTLLSLNYGIAIGGNVVLIDYIVLLAVLITVNTYVIKGRGLKSLLKLIVLIAVFLLAMVLENRKSELIVGVFVAFCCFISKITKTTLPKRLRNIIVALFAAIIVIIAIAFIAHSGYANRLVFFLKNINIKAILQGKDTVDISSGRLKLWEKAFQLFKENPIFGIGWGRFSDHIQVYNSIINEQLANVHNNYLQLLCEIGIVGFLLVIAPMLVLFRMTIKTSHKLKSLGHEADDLRIINSTAWGFQLFHFIISIIDPSWYKIIFWWFYAIAVMLAQTALRIAKEKEG